MKLLDKSEYIKKEDMTRAMVQLEEFLLRTIVHDIINITLKISHLDLTLKISKSYEDGMGSLMSLITPAIFQKGVVNN